MYCRINANVFISETKITKVKMTLMGVELLRVADVSYIWCSL